MLISQTVGGGEIYASVVARRKVISVRYNVHKSVHSRFRKMTERKATVTALRENLAKYLDETREGPLRVMKHSETAAYLVSAKEFEQLVDKLEDLLDIVEGMEALKELKENPGLAVDAEEVFKELGL